MDGINLLPYMKGLLVDKPMRELYWRSAYNYAARFQNWKILIDDERKTVELYNLAKDPGERDDVQEMHPVILQQLKATIRQWDKDLQKPAWPWILNYKVEINGKVYYFAV